MNTLDLNGRWQVRWFDGQRGANRAAAERTETLAENYIDAEVPGEIHLDLMRQGLIEDTNRAAHVLSARWVEEFFWVYRRVVEVPAAAAASGARAWLVFDRLDLAARIVLNGVEVGRHTNAFYPCRVDVTGKLQPGANVLAVHVESGLYEACDKPGHGYAHHEDGLLHKRHWSRKPQCQFGWDWAPRLINVGITGAVRLEWTAGTVRVDRFVPLATLQEDLQRGSVTGRLFVEGLGAARGPATLVLSLPELGLETRTTVEVAPGMNKLETALEVSRPELWWPIGHGPARLYTVRATLEVPGMEPAVCTARIGFRHVLWDQSKHPRQGSYFMLVVNGRPIFCKGGNFVPADTITARIDDDRYRQLVDLAIESNYNFLRVWGGGLYESDAFYDLCDERGLLVWQEFIYACSRYPMVDEAFHEDAKREAVHQVRRLAAHPSLVAWCGNNEMEEGNWHWGFDKKVVHPDYAFFHLSLRRILNTEDPTRFYQPSSPLSPYGTDPRDNHVGDQHPWTLGFFDLDTRKYRQMDCRFPNEGGVLGPTALPTMLECLDPKDPRIGSFAWRVHDNSIATWREPGVIDGATAFHLGKPMGAMSVEQFVYWAGVVQGEGLKDYVENFRRRMFDSACAVFWMYNDTWPAVRSWTTVDYRLRRTPCFHYVRRAMAPVHVIPVHEDGRVSVYGVNDTPEAVSGELRYGLFNLSGGYPLDQRAQVRLAANASTLLATFDAAQWADPAAAGAFAILSRQGGIVARNRLFLHLFKDMRWAPAEIQVRRRGSRAAFLSAQYVPAVCIDLDGGPTADNFFDLLPGVEHEIDWPADRPLVVRTGCFSGEGVEVAARPA